MIRVVPPGLHLDSPEVGLQLLKARLRAAGLPAFSRTEWLSMPPEKRAKLIAILARQRFTPICGGVR